VAVNEQDGRRINSVNGGVTTRPTTEKETHPKQNKTKQNKYPSQLIFFANFFLIFIKPKS
jgi:hypothetical protein